MKPAAERLGLTLAITGLLTFWIPPVGLFVSIAALIVTIQKFSEARKFSRLSLGISILAILLFVGLWSTIWVLSQ